VPLDDEISARKRIVREFEAVVNLTADELGEWLETDRSKGVGWPDGALGESIGRSSGRKIVSILNKQTRQRTADDYAHMRKVVGFVRRHSAQEPANRVTSRWRYSLMNWGHDPLKSLGER
jgi:hypothetical protein